MLPYDGNENLKYSADEKVYDEDWAGLWQNWICDLVMALEDWHRW